MENASNLKEDAYETHVFVYSRDLDTLVHDLTLINELDKQHNYHTQKGL